MLFGGQNNRHTNRTSGMMKSENQAGEVGHVDVLANAPRLCGLGLYLAHGTNMAETLHTPKWIMGHKETMRRYIWQSIISKESNDS